MLIPSLRKVVTFSCYFAGTTGRAIERNFFTRRLPDGQRERKGSSTPRRQGNKAAIEATTLAAIEAKQHGKKASPAWWLPDGQPERKEVLRHDEKARKQQSKQQHKQQSKQNNTGKRLPPRGGYPTDNQKGRKFDNNRNKTSLTESNNSSKTLVPDGQGNSSLDVVVIRRTTRRTP